MKSLVSLVIPTYNEVGNLEKLYEEIVRNLSSKYSYEIIFVDDGSTDESLKIIKKIKKNDKRIKFISFTRNFGHQSALKAGLDNAKGDCVISLDADLQHPPSMISEMLKEWKKGFKIVYTKRVREDNTSYYKLITSKLFYYIINKLSQVRIEYGMADFRLLDRKVVEIIKNTSESAFFLRGLVAWTGFPSKSITYTPDERYSGQTKYSLHKMMNMAIDAVTSFSIVPLRLATILGFFISLVSGIYALYAVIVWITDSKVITGWPSVIVSVLFIGGMQLMMLGIVGEYVGKVFLESKKRPLYIIGEME